MDWDDIRLLLEVQRAGSVRGAARALRLDPSTVSRRMQRLEDGMGVQLFERQGAGLVLSRAAEELTAVAEQMESRLGAVERGLKDQRDVPSGRVRVSFPEILGRPIQQLLADIPARYPLVSLELSCSDQMVSLAAGEAEIVVRMEEQPPVDLVGVRLGALVLSLCSSASYAARVHATPTLEELGSAAQWVDWGPRFQRKAAMKWLDATYPERRVVAQGDSGQAVLMAIESGMGIGIVASLHAEHLHTWRRLPESVCPSVWFLSSAEAATRPSVRAVLDQLKTMRDVFRSHLYLRHPKSPALASEYQDVTASRHHEEP